MTAPRSKVCRRCNSSFEASHGNQRYCTKKCKNLANNTDRRHRLIAAVAALPPLPPLDPWDPNDREPVGCSFCGQRTYHWTGCPEEAA